MTPNETNMSRTLDTPPVRVDQFFTVAEARFDRWRRLLQTARAWEVAANRQLPEKETLHARISTAVTELLHWGFFAYPGAIAFVERADCF